jgi:hypothetical protein
VQSATGTMSCLVYGLGQLTQPSPLRPDGRLYPRGVFAQAVATVAGATNLLGLPGLAQRWLLRHISASQQTAGTYTQITAVVGGFTAQLLIVWGVGQDSIDFESGLLCDENTLVYVSGINATGTAQCTVDNVI